MYVTFESKSYYVKSLLGNNDIDICSLKEVGFEEKIKLIFFFNQSIWTER